MTPGAAGSAEGSTAPFTGGRSWNMKSHFHRSEGFEACSQCRADTGSAERERGQPLETVDPAKPRDDIGADVTPGSRNRTGRPARRSVAPESASRPWRRPGQESRARFPATVPVRSCRTPPSRRTTRLEAQNPRRASGRSSRRPGRRGGGACRPRAGRRSRWCRRSIRRGRGRTHKAPTRVRLRQPPGARTDPAPSAGCRPRRERARTFAPRSRWEHRPKAP